MTSGALSLRRRWSNQTAATESEVLPTNIESDLSRASSRSDEVWLARTRVDPDAPHRLWAEPLGMRLFEFLTLKEGWDSYGARPVSPEAMDSMVSALEALDYNIRSGPTVLPTSEGGLLCQWSSGSYSVQLTSDEVGEMAVYFSSDPDDDGPGEEWEGPLKEADEVGKWLWQSTAPSK